MNSRYIIALRLEHPRIDPDEVTSALGIDPDRCWSMGSARTGPDGELLPGFNKENSWFKVFNADLFEGGVGFEKALWRVVGDLQASGDFLRSFRLDGGVISLETFWIIGRSWPEEKLRHSLLHALGDLEIDLILMPQPAGESDADGSLGSILPGGVTPRSGHSVQNILAD